MASLFYKDFAHLEKTIDMSHFKKNRREFRDEMLKERLDNRIYSLDNKRKKINIEESVYNFSTSYSGYKIIFIKSLNKVGIDIELYKNISVKNIPLFASKEELNSLDFEFESSSILEKATLIWCIKESVGKLFDVGLSKGFDTFKLKEQGGKIYLATFLNLLCENYINVSYKKFKDFCVIITTFQRCYLNQEKCFKCSLVDYSEHKCDKFYKID